MPFILETGGNAIHQGPDQDRNSHKILIEERNIHSCLRLRGRPSWPPIAPPNPRRLLFANPLSHFIWFGTRCSSPITGSEALCSLFACHKDAHVAFVAPFPVCLFVALAPPMRAACWSILKRRSVSFRDSSLSHRGALHPRVLPCVRACGVRLCVRACHLRLLGGVPSAVSFACALMRVVRPYPMLTTMLLATSLTVGSAGLSDVQCVRLMPCLSRDQ